MKKKNIMKQIASVSHADHSSVSQIIKKIQIPSILLHSIIVKKIPLQKGKEHWIKCETYFYGSSI